MSAVVAAVVALVVVVVLLFCLRLKMVRECLDEGRRQRLLSRSCAPLVYVRCDKNRFSALCRDEKR